MMDTHLYISFLIVSSGLILVPGPNILVIVSTSIKHGKRHGLKTVAGTSLAMAVQLLIVDICTTGFIQFLTIGFSVLKWLGVIFLLYLGFQHLRRVAGTTDLQVKQTVSPSFSLGFFVSLTNPKTILFFCAFLPQFISSADHYLQQMSILSATFLLLAMTFDACYAILAARLQPVFEKHNFSSLQHGLSGILYLGASAWLAISRRV